MSSRRDSRVHISVRQNDALLEFENFKRKYLLVNKHITKLNSTLSVRVEELNAQVSSLYVENLRLRASEISLISQLKREKEKTQQVVEDAENAVGTLMQHLTGIRTSLEIRPTNLESSSPNSKRKLPLLSVGPPREATRLVRPPAEAITQIRESGESDADEEDDDDTPTRFVTSRRPSSSRLPLPKPLSSPPIALPTPRPTAIPHINLIAGATKRKGSRRNGALLTMDHISEPERAPSPIVRPTSVKRSRRRSSELEEEEREVELHVGGGLNSIPMDLPRLKHEQCEEIDRTSPLESMNVERRVKKNDRKGKGRELPQDWERETEALSTSERESSESAREKDKRRIGIKDVTNSPRKAISKFVEEQPAEGTIPSSKLTISTIITPRFDTLTPCPSPSPLLSAMSTPATDGGFECGENTGGRERRTRKSVNYAEPKLNTKMRKPDPPPEAATRPRTSAGTVARRRKSIPTPNFALPSDEDGDADAEGTGSTKWTDGRRKTVHNTTVNDFAPPTCIKNADVPTDSYGMWEADGRRHSMAV